MNFYETKIGLRPATVYPWAFEATEPDNMITHQFKYDIFATLPEGQVTRAYVDSESSSDPQPTSTRPP